MPGIGNMHGQKLNKLLQEFLTARAQRQSMQESEEHHCQLVADMICQHAPKVVFPFRIPGGYYLITTHDYRGQNTVILVKQIEQHSRFLIFFNTWEKLGLETVVQVLEGPSGSSHYVLGEPSSAEWENFSEWTIENIGWITDFIEK